MLSIMVSGVKARKNMSEACTRYLAHILSKMIEPIPSLQNILIVCEFQDMFSSDLLGLTTNREVKFSIELAAKTMPISKASYRIT